jgi:phosphotransferase system HPr (HPr) family protein
MSERYLDAGRRVPVSMGDGADSVSPLSVGQQPSLDAMNGEVLRRKTVIVKDPMGLHMRPLTVFAQRAGQFAGTVTVIKDDQRVNGKSPLELMLLAAEQGTELILEVSGPDADSAIDVLAELLAGSTSEDEDKPVLPPKG